ncbi:MAG: stress response translation initiation inhibitor YciH [Candidatus Micrarchaeota archaeon]|nr:stress response translation initiation inhibitor YciH [Candidatus Micrarchaeota archaeon]
MSEICPKCGLPLDICACQSIQKETTQHITLYTTKKRFNKLVTIVQGLSGDALKETAKSLKHKLACGGSSKDGLIVLQGDHVNKAKQILISLGYPEEMIYIKFGR